MNDGDEFDRKLARQGAMLGRFIGPLAYADVLLQFPDYWATIRFIPAFGSGWLALR